MDKNNLPIGVFDSGVGGISVLRHLLKILPYENYIYYGDSANAPYGTKSHKQIQNLVDKRVSYLAKRGIKALVIACNTATSVCVDFLREKYPDMPIIGIEPALKPAVNDKENPTVVVMATPLTLKEDKFSNLCKSYENKANIIPLPCPGLMELIEKGKINDRETKKYLEEKFESIKDTVDSVVLGCTHYPFVKETIEKILPDVKIYDGGEGTARQVRRILESKNLLNANGGEVVFENSLDDKDIIQLSKKLLNS